MAQALPYLLTPSLVILGSIIVLLILRKILFHLLHRWAQRTQNTFDDLFIAVFRAPSLYGCLSIGLFLGVGISDLPDHYLPYFNKTIYCIIILTLTIALANLVGGLYKNYIHKTQLPIPATGLAYGILKGSVFIIGFLIILTALGVSIAPLLTALGVGGLAVALALQDTLSNLFAGIHILLEKSIRIGDFIRLESGQEGQVTDITWRTTRIKMPSNTMVVIPNSKLSQSVITNYHLPEKQMAISIPVHVGYDSDPERIERILLDECAKAAGEVRGLIEEARAEVRFSPGFGESWLDFTLICQIQDVTDQFSVQHELRKRILKRFKEEHIEIPFPQRMVRLREEKPLT
jgi:small-conductance mechanosensitive channel